MRPRTNCRLSGSIASAAVVILLAGAARGADIEVIFTKIPQSPTSLVPGALDANGLPANTRFRAIDDFTLSPDGSAWMLRGQTQQVPLLESILIRGGGTSGTGFAQEGQPFPQGGISETYDLLGRGGFSSKNEFGFSAYSRGGAITPSVATIYWDGLLFNVQARSGDTVSGLLDVKGEVTGDELVGGFVDSAHLLDSGVVGAHFESFENIDVTRDRALVYGTTAFQQIDVSSVVGLNGAGTEIWERWDEEPFQTTPDGRRWLALGKVQADNDIDSVLVVDGRIVLREGFAIPGASPVVENIANGRVIPCGDWFARGTDRANLAYALRNGLVIAQTGSPVPDEPGATWGDAFYGLSGNCAGAWALAGKTAAPAASDDVIAVTGIGVVVREGDPVDINGDGLFNDDAFIGRGNNALEAFAPDQIALSEDGVIYFIANLRNGAGQDLNSDPAFGPPTAFMRIQLYVCAADFDGDGFVTGIDYDLYVAAFEAGETSADFDGDGFNTGIDFDLYVDAFEAGC